MHQTVYVGGDPEFFVANKKTRVPKPAHEVGFLTADETLALQEPYMRSMPLRPFRDGYAVELNFAPSHCRETMTTFYTRQLRMALAKAETHDFQNGIFAMSAVNVEGQSTKNYPKDVIISGCRKSQNAYGEEITPPKNLLELPFRSAGGHFHLSWDGGPQEIIPLVKKFDIFCGLPFTYIFQDRPAIFLRRTIYGRAGEYRTPGGDPYSQRVEYRTPGSEAWLAGPLISFFSGLLRNAVLTPIVPIPPDLEPVIQNAINTGEGIKDLCEKFTLKGWLNLEVLEALRSYAKKIHQVRVPGSSRYGFSEWAARVLPGALNALYSKPSSFLGVNL